MIRNMEGTNILGHFVRRTHPALQLRFALAMELEETAISVVTRAETRIGLARLDAKDKRRESIDCLLKQIPALPWTAEAADRYAEFAIGLQHAGQAIAQMDTMIAAHAAVTDLPLVTHSTRHFSCISELALEDWAV